MCYYDDIPASVHVFRSSMFLFLLGIATSTWSDSSSGDLGDDVVLGYVWRYGPCGCFDVLQARYQVRHVCVVADVWFFENSSDSIQTWAMKEAKARMEARGERTDYP